MAVETPAYEVLIKDGPYEVRRYDAYLVAAVHVNATGFGSAANAGFNPLADYIFGNNHESGRIAMTVPVSAARSGRKIAMTAPVTSARTGDDYVVSFTMPSSCTMDTLPEPNNPAVELARFEPRTVAAVRFSGFFSDLKAAEEQSALEAWMARRGLVAAGEPVAAQYDAPWKVWFARRNEIIIPIEEPADA